MRVPGIDISGWQGDFDLAKAKSEGFEFVILKGGGSDAGRYTDPKFKANYEKAKALDMPVGVYWYTDAQTVAEAVADADYLYENCLKGRQFALPIYLDVEGRMLKLSRRLLTDICHGWCRRLEEKGCCVGIYAGFYTFRDNLYDEELQDYAHWLAQWSSSPSYSRESLGMWQYGGETNVLRSNQVAGQVCDQDYMLIDYPSRIRAAGLNGYSECPDHEPGETAEEIKKEEYTLNMRVMRKGDSGEDVRALQILLKGNGYDAGAFGPKGDGVDGQYGAATARAVRKLQEDRDLLIDEIAGPQVMESLLGV